MSNYSTMSETNDGINKIRRSIKSNREYLEGILKGSDENSNANQMARQGMQILELQDHHASQAYVSTGCQYNDSRMNYLEAFDMVQDCQSEIIGTSVKEEIEKEIALEVSMRICMSRFEAVDKFFNNRDNLEEIDNEALFIDGRISTIREYLYESQYHYYMQNDGGYDASDYD